MAGFPPSPPHLEHQRVLWVELAPARRQLGDRAQQGRVQRPLLRLRIRGGGGKGRVHMLIPRPPQPRDLGSECPHAPALSCATTASATWLVPTEVGSSRRSLRSYVTLFPTAITLAMALSIASAASCSSRCRSISTPESITAIGLTLFNPAYFGADPC